MLDELKILTMFGCSTSARNRRSAGRLGRVRVVGVDEALEHDPPIRDVAIAGEIDPTHAAVGKDALDLIPTGD